MHYSSQYTSLLAGITLLTAYLMESNDPGESCHGDSNDSPQHLERDQCPEDGDVHRVEMKGSVFTKNSRLLFIGGVPKERLIEYFLFYLT